jgi:adenylate kinase family enzyme
VNLKIHITGGPGSGKTWIAHKLSGTYNIPAFDLDHIFWEKNARHYGIKAPPEKRDSELKKILSNRSWIIEGVYYSWLRDSFHLADLIIILKTSIWLRDVRIIRRFVKRKLGMITTKRESLSDLQKLIKWNHGYDNNNLKPALDFVSEYQDKIIFPQNESQIIREIDLRKLTTNHT